MASVLISDKLKASLLQAAIQGQLTKQLPQDGDARDLLNEIKAEKSRLIDEKIIKKEKPLPAIAEDEIPFEIPENWVWVRFSEVLDVRDGTHDTPKYQSKGIPLVTSKNLKSNSIDFENIKFISEIDAEKINNRSKVDVGDIIFAMIGSIGNPVINTSSRNFCIKNVALFKNFSQRVDIFYFYFYLLFVEKEMKSSATGGVQSFVSLTLLRRYIFPLPPLAEQHRIVEAIENALAKIDVLKADEEKLYHIEKAFPKQLKASILQSAIQGKLTKQLPEDGDARDLLKEIETEKARLIDEKIIKKEKPLPAITEDEIPFEIPENWVWVRMADVCLVVTDGAHHTPKYMINGVPFLSVKNITKDFLDLENTKFISQIEHQQLIKRCYPKRGDLLLSKVGTTGVPLVIDTDTEFSIFVSLALLKMPLQIYNHFLCLAIKSPFAQEQVKSGTKGVGNKNWVLRDISKMLIPLPPLAEQHRIVEAIEKAFVKIDALIQIAET